MKRPSKPITMTALAAVLAVSTAAAPAPERLSGDVMAVTLRPATGRTELVIDLRGTVEVSDFVLENPARVVVDLVGARLVAPLIAYDGAVRGPVRHVRYAQFRPDVVRVVVELDQARDYELTHGDGAVRVAVEGGTPFEVVWSSAGPSAGVSARTVAPESPAQATATAAALPAAIPARAEPASARPSAPVPVQETQQPRISVTFDNATMAEVVATFGAFSGRSIILGKDISGNVLAEIRDQPWDVAFNAILAGQGLAATQLPGGIIRVDSRAALAAQDSLEPLVTRIVPINYARALALQPSVVGILSPRGRAVADTVNNTMIVTELASRIARVDTFLLALDQRTPQVAIQARIIFVQRTQLEQLGLRYDLGTSSQFFNQLVQRPDPNNPGTNYDPASTVVNLGGNAVAAIANATTTFPTAQAAALNLVYSTVIGDFTLTAFLEALQQVSLSDIQAEPSVTVADNRSARIFSGEETPIRQVDVGSLTGGAAAPRATTTFKETGINLTVTPHVVAGTREILMQIQAERSAVVASPISEIGAVFNRQQANSQMLVRDGETAVIGGLTVTEVTVSKSGIPFLVDLPVIGGLFGFRETSEARRDLLILVTPHIVDDLMTAGTGGQNR